MLILRTGIGVKHAYSRQQVAKLLRLNLQQEGRLEQRAVAGLSNASTKARCANPLGSLGSAVHLAASAALSLFAGSVPDERDLVGPAILLGAASAGKTPEPVRTATEVALRHRSPTTGGANPRIRSAGITSPPHGGIDWLLLALLFAAGATAVWLIYSRRRPHPATGAGTAPARLRTRFLREGAGAFAGARARSLRQGASVLAGGVGLVALRGALAERRRRAQLAEPASAPPSESEPAATEAGVVALNDAGDRSAEAIAAFELGGELAQNNDAAGAEAAFRHADRHGHPSAATNLGVLLEQRGDLVGAEAAYRRADERGDATGAFNLGGLLAERHDLAGSGVRVPARDPTR